MRLSKERQASLLSLMNNIAAMLYKGIITVVPLSEKEGVGEMTFQEKNKAIIRVCVNMYFVDGTTEEEADTVLLGIFTHELLHVFLTKTIKTEKLLKKYPPREHDGRHEILNLVEDPAIEYLKDSRLSDTMTKALRAAIAYFHRNGHAVNKSGSTAYMQLVTALICLGDLGFYKGYFTFPEAEEAFEKSIWLMDQAIEEPVFEKRFDLAMQIYDVVKPLMEEQYARKFGGNEMTNLYKGLGRGYSSSSSSSDPGDPSQGNGSSQLPNAASKRRKTILHLIDEKIRNHKNNPAGQQPQQDASDIYVDTRPEAQEEGNLSPLELDPDADYEIVDERKHKNDPADAKKEEKGKQPEKGSSSGQMPSGPSSPVPSSGNKQKNGQPDNGKDGSSAAGQGSKGNEKTDKGSSDSSAAGQNDGDPEKDGNGNDPSGGKRSDAASGDGKDGSSAAGQGSKGNEKTGKGSSGSSAAGQDSGDPEKDGEENGPSGGKRSDAASGDGKDSPSTAGQDSNGKNEADSSTGDQAGHSSGESREGEKGSGSSSGEKESADKKDPNASNDHSGKETDSKGADNSAKPTTGPEKTFSDRLRELMESIRVLAEDELSPSEELLKMVKSMLDEQKKLDEAEEKRQQKLLEMDDIDVTVSSPYYSNYPYMNKEIPAKPGINHDIFLRDEMLARHITGLKAGFKKIFKQKEEEKEYRTSGKLDLKRFGGRKITARMFTKTRKPENKADLSIVILVDQSGSMKGNIPSVKRTLVLLLEALRPFDVKVKVVGFTTLSTGVAYFHYGNKKWENDRELEDACMQIKADGGTFLGHAIRYTGTLLKKREEKSKIFICITDGDPTGGVYKNSSQGVNDCREAVRDIKKFSDVIGIGVYSENAEKELFEYIFGEDSCVTMSDLNALIMELPRRIKRLLK